jgi:hypothetical protein
MKTHWFPVAALVGCQLAIGAAQAVAAEETSQAPKPPGSQSQASQPQPSQPQSSPSSAPEPLPQPAIPEVKILADYDTDHLSAMRKDIVKLEDDFYDAYNKLNDNRLYDVNCGWEIPTGTRFPVHVCAPVFQEHAEHDAAVSLLDTGSTAVESSLQWQWQDYQKRMVALVSQHPELIKKLQEHSALLETYAEVQKKKHANGKIFVWD